MMNVWLIAALPLDVISQVVLVGAGTRVPKVQEKLQAFVKTELSKNINTDEAAVLGAVYKAAELSQGFKVKKFINKDAVLFPIQIVFERTVEDQVKQVMRIVEIRAGTYTEGAIVDVSGSKNAVRPIERLSAEEDHYVQQARLRLLVLHQLRGTRVPLGNGDFVSLLESILVRVSMYE